MSMFSLPSSVWPLPICLDSWTWHSRFLCFIALYSIGPCFDHQPHPQLGVVFALAPSLHSFWSYFSTLLQKHIGCLPTWEVHLSVLYLFAFSYCSWGSQGKNTELVCHSLLQWTTFCQNFPPWPVSLGWPHTARLIVSLSYTRLWSLWSFWLVFCDCGFHSGGCGTEVLVSSVCPLMDESKRLVQAFWWEGLQWGKLCLALVGRAILSKSLVQFSADSVAWINFHWGELNKFPPKLSGPSLQDLLTCYLHNKRGFSDVSKLKFLRWKDLSWVIWVKTNVITEMFVSES